jgi:hypothetical protein
MTAQRLVTTLTTLAGGAVGLFAPIGFVQWLCEPTRKWPAF